MKKLILAFSLHLLFLSFVGSQTVVDSDCNNNMDNILNVHNYKIKYEAVKSLYQTLDINDSVIKNKNSFLHISKASWNTYFLAIRGHQMDDYEAPPDMTEEEVRTLLNTPHEARSALLAPKMTPVEWISEEKINEYIKQLNCTPEKALKEYLDCIRNIKSEKEKYLKCIDAELAKGDLSEYATDILFPYSFVPPWQSLLPLPVSITKLDFLKVLKEFVINGNEEVLPDGLRAYAYIKCGCKIP